MSVGIACLLSSAQTKPAVWHKSWIPLNRDAGTIEKDHENPGLRFAASMSLDLKACPGGPALFDPDWQNQGVIANTGRRIRGKPNRPLLLSASDENGEDDKSSARSIPWPAHSRASGP